MGDRLADKVAIITGAGANIGRGVAQRFAREGAKVAVIDINEPNALETCRMIAEDGGMALPFALDVTDEAAISKMVASIAEKWGRVDILHNNAVARNYPQKDKHPILDFDPQVWLREFEVTIIGATLICKYVIPHMRSAGGGAVINTTSVNGLVGDLHRPQYGACKAALINLTMSIATQFGKDNIRCNAIAPGLFPREGAAAHPYGKADSPYLIADRQQLIQRRGLPEDVAALALFLASDEASFITGRVIPCDGGIIGVHHFDYADMTPLTETGAQQSAPWMQS